MAAAAPLRSWVPVEPESHFPVQNLPFGVFSRTADPAGTHVVGSRIGDTVVDLNQLAIAGVFGDDAKLKDALAQPTLNAFMALGRPSWLVVRNALADLLKEGGASTLSGSDSLKAAALVPLADVQMHLPAQIGDYTDFYSSRYHATNVGIMFRGKENALMPNWLHIPVGYHGRASSVVVSGTPLHRPCGQQRPNLEEPPIFAPCRLLDFELEMAFFVGPGSALGERVPVDEARDHIFGVVVMNDWSARDIQKWEYVPLGPFNGKNFGTTISPWVVSLEALAPFAEAGPEQKDPAPLPYLTVSEPKDHQAFNVELQVAIQSAKMDAPHPVATTNMRNLYWTQEQQLAHHTSTGCNIKPGDLMGSGTISGPEPGSYGSMLEISWKGTKPLTLPDGTERKFIADGDTVVVSGFCQGDGYRVGFGDCVGKILPAITK